MHICNLCLCVCLCMSLYVYTHESEPATFADPRTSISRTLSMREMVSRLSEERLSA